MKINARINSWLYPLNEGMSAKNFALFRILFSLYLLWFVYMVAAFRPILFDQMPPFTKSLFPAKFLLVIWGSAIFFLLIGFRTKIAAIINYLTIVIVTAFFSNTNAASFNDDILRMCSFFLIFMPVSRHFSIDALINRTFSENPVIPKTSKLNYYIMSLLSIGLLYFASGITKTYSPLWLSGLGAWTPASVPFKRWNDISIMLDNEFVMRFINYLTIVWEISFVFLVFNKRFRATVMVLGIMFHAAIAFTFSFPVLCIGSILCYLLFIPDRFWNWLSVRFTSPNQLIIYYCPDRLMHKRTVQFLKAIDYRNKFIFREQPSGSFTVENLQVSEKRAVMFLLSQYWLYQPVALILHMLTVEHLVAQIKSIKNEPVIPYTYKRQALILFALMLIGTQLIVQVYHAYSAITHTPEKQQQYIAKRRSTYDFSFKPIMLARSLFGINGRGLFLDHSNSGTKASYRISYFKDGQRHLLPLVNDKGYCLSMNRDIMWSKLSYHYIAFGNTPPDSTGLKKFTWFWAKKNHVPLDSIDFIVDGRAYEMPKQFEIGYLAKMEAKPWIKEGVIQWRNNVFSYQSHRADSITGLYK